MKKKPQQTPTSKLLMIMMKSQTNLQNCKWKITIFKLNSRNNTMTKYSEYQTTKNKMIN